MSARTRSVRDGMLRAIRRIRYRYERQKAWSAFRALPPEFFDAPGSQAVLRAERQARIAERTPGGGR